MIVQTIGPEVNSHKDIASIERVRIVHMYRACVMMSTEASCHCL